MPKSQKEKCKEYKEAKCQNVKNQNIEMLKSKKSKH